MTAGDAMTGEPLAEGISLADVALPVEGLYRRHPTRNLSAVAAAIVGSYQGTGPARLGGDRGLMVLAVDGLGLEPARSGLDPDKLIPLTSEFPTTTVACMLTAVTGRQAGEHGFIGVQYLHEDGVRAVNCHDGTITEPTGPGAVQPTMTPVLPTVFESLADMGVTVTLLLNELAALHADVRTRLARGGRQERSHSPRGAGVRELIGAFSAQVLAHRPRGGVTWAYLDLDTHIHQGGYGGEIRAAVAGIDRLASRLRDQGTTVLLFSDHGLTRSSPSQDTIRLWSEADRDRWCRLPAGGAGRVRWLYPHPRHEDRLADLAAEWFPGTVVLRRAQLADWGLIPAGSVGLHRLGEIVLLGRGADVPVPGRATLFEHGSMTAEELLVPLAVWLAS